MHFKGDCAYDHLKLIRYSTGVTNPVELLLLRCMNLESRTMGRGVRQRRNPKEWEMSVAVIVTVP